MTSFLSLWDSFGEWCYRTFTIERYEDGTKMRPGDIVTDWYENVYELETN